MHLHHTWHWKVLLLLRQGLQWLSTLAWNKSSMFNTSTNTPILTEHVPRTNTALFIIWWWISKKAIKWHNIALDLLNQCKETLHRAILHWKLDSWALSKNTCFCCSVPSCFTLIMWADRSARCPVVNFLCCWRMRHTIAASTHNAQSKSHRIFKYFRWISLL